MFYSVVFIFVITATTPVLDATMVTAVSNVPIHECYKRAAEFNASAEFAVGAKFATCSPQTSSYANDDAMNPLSIPETSVKPLPQLDTFIVPNS